MVKMFAKVRIMITMIFGSLVSLFWLFVLVVVVIYAFGIILTQGATDWRTNSKIEASVQEYQLVNSRFGSLYWTMYTLFLCMTGGLSWGEAAILALPMGMFYFVVFIFFMFFTFFSVLNIATGVCVDSAIQVANSDRALRMIKDQESRQTYADDLRELLLRVDVDHDGEITRDEWETSVELDSVKFLLSALDVKVHDATEVFNMLDVDDDGSVGLVELVDGLEKLQGYARSVDAQQIILWLRRQATAIDRIMERVGIDDYRLTRPPCTRKTMIGTRASELTRACLLQS
jgi:Ca2+-binding EF-hand superfamily protein